MAASRYVPKPAPFLNEIMFYATLPKLRAHAEKIKARAQKQATARFGVNKDGKAPSYAQSIVVNTGRTRIGGLPRAAVTVGPTVVYADKIEQRHAIMARSAGARLVPAGKKT